MAVRKNTRAATFLATSLVALLTSFFLEQVIHTVKVYGLVDPIYYLFFPYTAPLSYIDIATIPEDSSCIALAKALPDLIHLPGAAGFARPVNAYWSFQAQALIPSCVARPKSATDVSSIVEVLKSRYDEDITIKDKRIPATATDSLMRFAIKGGGHSPEAGVGSIESGVLIDLGHLNSVDVASDRQTATIGGGARWGKVFATMDGMGLAVAGGRSADVGVGGLTLGGGISYMSPRVGLVCNNVLEYEVVLANGSVVQASESRHAELWRALKGGSGNFGIVTKITARTFPGTKVWGGWIIWPAWVSEKIIDAFYNFTRYENFDEHAAGPILCFGFSNKILGLSLHGIASGIAYTQPEAWPKVWKNFVPSWRLSSTVKMTTTYDLAEALVGQSPFGDRQNQATVTIKSDLETLKGIHQIYVKSLSKTKHVKSLTRSLVVQPLDIRVAQKGTPNVLGLGSRNISEPLVIVLITESWSRESDDQLVLQTTRQTISDMRDFAVTRGTMDEYIYLNYAAGDQKVFESYGADNLQFLRRVSHEYDPTRFWQVAKRGGFKLDSA